MSWVDEHRKALAWGLGVVALLAALAESVWPRLGPYWTANPLRLQVATSIFVLLATYLVVNVILVRRENDRWREAGGPALYELKAAANALDGQIYSWCLAFTQLTGLDVVHHADRAARNDFVKWNLRKTCEEPDSYDTEPAGSARMRFRSDVDQLRAAYRNWASLLILSRDLQDVAARVPRVLKQADAFVNLTDVYAAQLSAGGTVAAGQVVPAWRRYEQQRRELTDALEEEQGRIQP